MARRPRSVEEQLRQSYREDGPLKAAVDGVLTQHLRVAEQPDPFGQVLKTAVRSGAVTMAATGSPAAAQRYAPEAVGPPPTREQKLDSLSQRLASDAEARARYQAALDSGELDESQAELVADALASAEQGGSEITRYLDDDQDEDDDEEWNGPWDEGYDEGAGAVGYEAQDEAGDAGDEEELAYYGGYDITQDAPALRRFPTPDKLEAARQQGFSEGWNESNEVIASAARFERQRQEAAARLRGGDQAELDELDATFERTRPGR
jgi:hypothetical protein